jgi:hypothetical protein
MSSNLYDLIHIVNAEPSLVAAAQVLGFSPVTADERLLGLGGGD